MSELMIATIGLLSLNSMAASFLTYRLLKRVLAIEATLRQSGLRGEGE